MREEQNDRTIEDLKSDPNMLIGMFNDKDSAEKAYNALHERGYTKDDVNLLMSDETRNRHFSESNAQTEIGTKAMEDAGKGSAIGATIGAVAGVIAAIGTSLVIPGLGLVIAGPIAAGLAGAGAGGITGGVIGALVGAGVSEERARIFESAIKKGKIVIGVRPRSLDDAKYLENVWRANNAEEIYGPTINVRRDINEDFDQEQRRVG